MYAQSLWLLVNVIFWCAASAASAEELLKVADRQFEPVKWSELAGWLADDHLDAFAAYQASCHAVIKQRHAEDQKQRPIQDALRNVCRKALDLRPKESAAARSFFEENFQPVRIGRAGEVEGLLTSYYEPIVQGSRFPNPEFHIPLYRRPRDLVAAGHKSGSKSFPSKSVRIGRRNEEGQLVPYYDRSAIEAGALDGQKLEICWLKNASDLLTIQIQGSARIVLEDGTPLRVNYDSHNGYSLLSHALNRSHRIPLEWMTAHPEEAQQERAANRSYMFFRITGLSNDGEPVGAQGVPLTPGRSIAVDRQHDYGTPFFIEANLPIESETPVSRFRRLVIAQDTGSAIVGAARADLYLGSGDDAGRIARRIRHPGRFTILLPRELDIVAIGKHMLSPKPDPKFAEVMATNGKGGAGSTKSKIDPRAASPKVKANPKFAEVVATNGKGGAGSTKSKIDPRAVSPKLKPNPKFAEVVATNGKGGAGSIKSKLDPRAMSPKLQADPKFAEVVATNHNGKGRAGSTRSKLDSRATSPKPQPDPKFAEVAATNHNGKGGTGSTKSKLDSRATSLKPQRDPKFAEVVAGKARAGSTKSKIDPRVAAAYARWRAISPRVD
jgi:peptidoglycan lytic transglycosylase A